MSWPDCLDHGKSKIPKNLYIGKNDTGLCNGGSGGNKHAGNR